MANGLEREGGGRIVPALRYRNAKAAIDWLCKAFGFAKKMVVPGEGDSIAHAELVLGNGMIMLGDVETEYGHLAVAPLKGQPRHARQLFDRRRRRWPLRPRQGGRR
jgi:hypothetical protein